MSRDELIAAIAEGEFKRLQVRVGSGEYEARRAVSCLVEPALGDLVLLALHDAGCHVLAVLEREGGGATITSRPWPDRWNRWPIAGCRA
jgi:hypothetical protein